MTAVSNQDGALPLTYQPGRGNQGSEFATSLATFLRTADTNAYVAGDVVSDSVSARCLAFPQCGKGGIIVSAVLTVAETDTADFDLFLFDQEPTNHADNAALALVTADQAKCIGVLRFLNGAKVNMGTNLELYRAVSAGTDQSLPPIAYATNDTSNRLFGLLVTRSAYTPISAAKFTIRLGLQRNVG